VPAQPGTNYPNTAIEPWIDSNPSNLRNLIAGWQQDRWSNGGARANVSAFTKDGGRTWTRVLLPNVTRCTGGPWTRASDPWVSISPNGTAYYMTLAFDNDLPSGAFGRNAMLVSRSFDGGATWTDPITLVRQKPGQILHDKNSLTADSTDSSFAYAVWDRLRDFTLPPGRIAAGPDVVKTTAGAGDGVVAARERAKQLRALAQAGRQPAQVFFEGPAIFTRTTNGGQSWERPRVVYDPGGNAQTINNLVASPPDGSVLQFFTEILPVGGTRIGMLRSNNKGLSFTGPTYPAVIATTFGTITPDAQELIRDGAILFDLAVNRRNGHLYLAWQDVRFSAVDAVAFSMSTDGGLTWSQPVKINKTPPNVNPLREQAFLPSIEVARDGTLVATYYDFRFDTDDGREAADYWVVFCDPDGADCQQPGNWGDEQRLTVRSFDYLHAPFANGLFLGDYMGLVAGASRQVYPLFGIAGAQDIANDFVRKIFLE
jgi:hypothetical protein